MSSDIGSASVNSAMTAVQGQMNDLSTNLLAVAMEMTGSQVNKAGADILVSKDLTAEKAAALTDNTLNADAVQRGSSGIYDIGGTTKASIKDMLGINVPDGDINITAQKDGTNTVIGVSYTNPDGKFIALAVGVDSTGKVAGFAPPKEYADKTAAGAAADSFSTVSSLEAVDSKQGILESWGISAQDMQPGDLFFVQQKLQQIKDLISTIQTTGKTYSDVMREVTQKFSQG